MGPVAIDPSRVFEMNGAKSHHHSNGPRPSNGEQLNDPRPLLNRADDVETLVDKMKSLIVPHIRAADGAAANRAIGRKDGPTSCNVLVEPMEPQMLLERLRPALSNHQGSGEDGLLDLAQMVLRHSVNTWDQGYMDKLCASTDAVGIVSEMLLAVLNTNVHVYQVSPALTVIEKETARSLANMFGLHGPDAGGISCQGGSASNFASLTIARGALYPDTKSTGNAGRRFAVFTSVQGHYSIQKAALASGMGTSSIVTVPSDKQHRMDPSALRSLVRQAQAEGRVPLYVSATAGTTVYGAFDPLRAISSLCREFNMWFHVDASWGGAAIFSPTHRHKLDGTELADSITFNPHKMLNVPVTCSFLLAKDIKSFHRANTLPAGYLFHKSQASHEEVWDLGDLTLQCGRRADSVKLALSWKYYGTVGYARAVDAALANAVHLATLVDVHPDFLLISPDPLPLLQVCFYYAPGGKMLDSAEGNSRRTISMVNELVAYGFMIDYAPGVQGSFFRVALNCKTLRSTVEGLLIALEKVGRELVAASKMGRLEV